MCNFNVIVTLRLINTYRGENNRREERRGLYSIVRFIFNHVLSMADHKILCEGEKNLSNVKFWYFCEGEQNLRNVISRRLGTSNCGAYLHNDEEKYENKTVD